MRLLSCALLGLHLRLVLLLFIGQSLEGGQAMGVWGGNDPDWVPGDLLAVPRLEYLGQVYLDLQPRELASANRRKPEGCSPVFVRVRLEDVRVPIEYPFEPLGCPHTTSSCLATVVCCCFATAQHNSRCHCWAGTSISQDEPFATTGYVRHFAQLSAQGVFDLDARLLRLFCVSPISGHQLGKAFHLFGSTSLLFLVLSLFCL